MPLFKTIATTFSNGITATIFVWKITETVEQLSVNIALKPESELRLLSMKSTVHQCGFLSIRQLLTVAKLTDSQLFYDETGKPFLTNGMHISISHSHEFSAIALCTVNIGIDIEKIRSKIALIAQKFCLSEMEFLEATHANYQEKLTAIWAVKEAVFKIENQKGISFKDHIKVSNFDNMTIQANSHFAGRESTYEMQQVTIEDYKLVYGIKN